MEERKDRLSHPDVEALHSIWAYFGSLFSFVGVVTRALWSAAQWVTLHLGFEFVSRVGGLGMLNVLNKQSLSRAAFV